jgi:alkylation response protein AidB-like acyl-CoA dehydrogenase
VAADLAATGLCRAMAPAELGAAELPVADVVDAVERLAYHDGATGWCGMIACTTSLLGGHLPTEWAETIYGDPAAVTGGFAAPVGRAEPTEGGMVVSGRWQWGSGTHHCTWIGGGCRVADGAAFVFFSPDQVTLLDTWYVAGLRGTGSTDYEVTDAFVPAGRWVTIGGPPVVDRQLYRFPFFGALALGVAAVALGLARRAYDELVTLAATKTPAQSTRTLAERAVVQTQVAEAEAARRSARLLVDDAVGGAWTAAASGDITGEQRRLLRLAATNATLQAAHAVDLCYHAGGGTAVYEDSPLQRVFRDVHVATQHAMVAPRTYEVVGRAALGLPTDLSQI